MVRRLTSPAFVGRGTQLDALLRLARADAPAVALVGGEAGVGKTRLVTELTQRTGSGGTLCLAGGCLEFSDQVFPLAPAAGILRSLSEQLDPTTLGEVLGPARSELSRLVPEIVDTSAVGDPPPSHRLFELFLGVLHRLTQNGRLVLVIEDLHWADASSRDLFGFLARLLRGPALLIGTYRSDELHRRHPLRPVLAEVRRATHPEDLMLDPLSRAEMAELVAGLTDRPADAQLTAEIHRRSNGNPFFAEELVAGQAGGAVSGTLRDVVLGRAVPLGEDAFRLLCIAAAAGGVDDLGVVSAVAGLSVDTVSGLLSELAASGLIVSDGTGWGFRHELAREVFEEQLLAGERTRIHAGLADQLRQRRPEQAGRISRHLWQAGDQPRALEWSVQAARTAERTGAMAEAQASYERALDVWDHVPGAADQIGWSRADLLLSAAKAAFQAGRHVRAVDLVKGAIDELTGDPVAEGSAWMQLVPYLWMAGRPGVEEAMARALELVPATPPSLERAWALASSGLVHLWQGEFSQARSVSQAALEMVGAVGDTDVESKRVQAWAQNVLATAAGGLGDPDAPDMLRQVPQRVREIGDLDQVGRAYVNLTAVLCWHGRHEEALAVASEGERVLEGLGNRLGNGLIVTFNKQDALLHLGRWDELEAAATELWDAADLAADAGFLVNYGLVQLRRGQLASARDIFEVSGGDLVDKTQRDALGTTSVALIELAVHDRAWDRARTVVERALPILSTDAVAAAEVAAAGIAAEAERAGLRPDHDVFEGCSLADRWLGQVHEAALPLSETAFGAPLRPRLGQAAAERRRLDKQHDPDQWTRLATMWDELKRPYDAAYSRLRAGEAVLLEAGVTDSDQRARAADLLARSHGVALELGALRLVEGVVTLARQARLDLEAVPGPEPAAQDRPFGLTDREIQVLTLLAEGRTNGEIGAALFVSRKTASTHVSHILRKLGAGNRVEAAAVAHRAGLIDETGEQGPVAR